jgi:CRISPR/Cas system CSM-associated protein Csm3 (group 7 of RAMP superfamily)
LKIYLNLKVNQKKVFLKHFKELPIRQHVSIGSNGAAKERGKFDEEVVYKGARFCFEIELLSKESDNQNFQNVLTELSKDTISIGGGTRKGFGKISIVECKTKVLDLTNKQDLDLYIYKTSSLNDDFWKKIQKQLITKPETETISICLKPKDFILIGSGFGSDLADTTPAKENAVIWEDGTPQLKSFYVLPGTSIKGALAHRTDYYYYQKEQIFLEDLFEQNADPSKVESKCKKELFGSVEDKAIPGNVFIPDVFIPCASSSLDVQPHVVIDAFTGGAAKGKLFQEEMLKINEPVLVSIQILKKEYSPNVRDAFNMAVEDLKTGMLALGASTNRGHGTFLKTNKQ